MFRAGTGLGLRLVARARVSLGRRCALARAASRSVSGQRLVSRECHPRGVASPTGQSEGGVAPPPRALAAPGAPRHSQGAAGGGVRGPGAVEPPAVADDSGRGLASGDAGAPGDRLPTVGGRPPAGSDLGPGSGGGLGRAWGDFSRAPAPAGGPHSWGSGATGAVGGSSTDLAPAQVGRWWDGLRMWIACGCRALKGVGWQWQHTRRTDPARRARHW